MFGIDGYIWIWIAAIFFGALFIFLWSSYNSFIVGRNKVKTDFSDVNVQLQRKASLIENLAAVVREYAKHEKGTFENVAKARSAVQDVAGPKQAATAENFLTNTLRSLFAVSESYPKLLASDNYQRLNEELKETEDKIAIYRETYNQTVLDYNTSLQTFPNLLAALIFGFKEEELFETLAKGTDDIKVAQS